MVMREAPEAAVLHEFADGLDEPLVRLMRIAVRALQEENASLARAFSQGSYSFDAFYRPANHGLAYWVTEPHLVYEVYKAWMPFVRVRWEAPVYPNSQKRADLAIYRDDAGEEPLWAFEAKWWGRNSPKVLDALALDIAKLASCHVKTERLFLMTFWWASSTDVHRTRSRAEIEQFCSTRPHVRLRFLGAFPTDCAGERATTNAEFTTALLEIDRSYAEATPAAT
jgi:hypothetical protein